MPVTLGVNLKTPDENVPGFELEFKVDDDDEAFRELRENGAPEMIAPTDRPWGRESPMFVTLMSI